MEQAATGQDFILFPVVGGAMARQKSSQSKGLRVEILRQQNTTRPLTGWIGVAA